MSASHSNDYCGHCGNHADWCDCQTCEHCVRWVGLSQDDAPLYCRTCLPMFVEQQPEGLHSMGVA